jgi:hypothetical protein
LKIKELLRKASLRHGSTRLGRVWLPLVASCLVATSCTVAQVGYDHLPRLALWRLDSYVALDAQQRAIAGRRLEELHAWHRGTQLDDYARLLREVQARALAPGVTDADVRTWRLAFAERWRPIAEQAAPGVAEIAGTLQPAQVERLRGELARDNRKLQREWLPADGDSRLKARTRRYVERAEFFLGDLTDAQVQTIRRMAAELPASEEQWYARRLDRQDELVTTVERIRAERPPPADATRWMRDHLTGYLQPARAAAATAPAGREAGRAATPAEAERVLNQSDAIAAAVLAGATPKQRQHLQRRLQEWIDLAEALAPRPTARGPAPRAAADLR